MFQYFMTLLPFSFSVLMFLAFVFNREKTETQHLIQWLIAVSAVYLYTNAMYVHGNVNDYRQYLMVDILGHFIVPMLPVVLFLALYSFRHTSAQWRRWQWLSVVATGFGTACLTIILLAGFDNCAAFLESYHRVRGFELQYDTTIMHVFLFFQRYLYFIVLSLEMFVMIGYIIYYLRRKRFGIVSLWRFVFLGGEATPLIIECWITLGFSLLCFIRMGFGRWFWIEHASLSALVSAGEAFLVYGFCSIGAVSHMYEGTLREMLHPLMQAPMHDVENNPLADAPADSLLPDEERLTDEVIETMENRQLFRNPNITLEDLAVQLNADRMVITQIIERHMGCSFREYVNRLRILYAKRYMMLHPFETQEKVALSSGFADAAAFNKKFRQMEGLTPREWSTQFKRTQKAHQPHF